MGKMDSMLGSVVFFCALVEFCYGAKMPQNCPSTPMSWTQTSKWYCDNDGPTTYNLDLSSAVLDSSLTSWSSGFKKFQLFFDDPQPTLHVNNSCPREDESGTVSRIQIMLSSTAQATDGAPITIGGSNFFGWIQFRLSRDVDGVYYVDLFGFPIKLIQDDEKNFITSEAASEFKQAFGKQQAKENCSRHTYTMSDLGTRDVTLEAYSRINLSSNQDGRDVEADLESSEPQQNVEAIDASNGQFSSTTEILSTIDSFNKFNEIDENTETYFMVAVGEMPETYKVFKNIVFYLSAARYGEMVGTVDGKSQNMAGPEVKAVCNTVYQLEWGSETTCPPPTTCPQQTTCPPQTTGQPQTTCPVCGTSEKKENGAILETTPLLVLGVLLLSSMQLI